MENGVGVLVLAGNGVGPELLHEEHLVGELRRDAVFGRFGFLDPVRQVAHKVEEEVLLGHRDHLVGDLDEQAETFFRLERQPLRYALAEVFGSRRRIHFESLPATHSIRRNQLEL